MSMVSVFVKEALPSKEVDWSEENQKHSLPVNINILSYPRHHRQRSWRHFCINIQLSFSCYRPDFLYSTGVYLCLSALVGFVDDRWWQIDPPRMSAWSVIDRRLIREQSFNVNSTPSHLQHCPGKPSNSNRKTNKTLECILVFVSYSSYQNVWTKTLPKA